VNHAKLWEFYRKYTETVNFQYSYANQVLVANEMFADIWFELSEGKGEAVVVGSHKVYFGNFSSP
jgi:hypothetical protein